MTDQEQIIQKKYTYKDAAECFINAYPTNWETIDGDNKHVENALFEIAKGLTRLAGALENDISALRAEVYALKNTK